MMGGYGPLYEIGKGHIDYPCAECQNCPFVKECLDVKIPEQADECWAYCEYYDKLLQRKANKLCSLKKENQSKC